MMLREKEGQKCARPLRRASSKIQAPSPRERPKTTLAIPESISGLGGLNLFVASFARRQQADPHRVERIVVLAPAAAGEIQAQVAAVGVHPLRREMPEEAVRRHLV